MSTNKTALENAVFKIQIAHTWAACDFASPDTREKAMADIAKTCEQALELLDDYRYPNKTEATPIDLLSALQQCLDYIERDEQRHGRQLPEGRAARAAIEKATGE